MNFILRIIQEIKLPLLVFGLYLWSITKWQQQPLKLTALKSRRTRNRKRNYRSSRSIFGTIGASLQTSSGTSPFFRMCEKTRMKHTRWCSPMPSNRRERRHRRSVWRNEIMQALRSSLLRNRSSCKRSALIDTFLTAGIIRPVRPPYHCHHLLNLRKLKKIEFSTLHF